MINTKVYEELKNLTNKDCILVAVSKTKSIEAIKELYDLGQRHFGENKVQELIQKQGLLPKDIHWHLIRPLQRNKVNKVVGSTYMIQTVSSIPLADKINYRANNLGIVQNILIQINIDNDPNKSGVLLEDVDNLIIELKNYENLKIKGIMTIGINTNETDIIRNTFSTMYKLFNKLKNSIIPEIEILSMGMSGDYNIALEEHSNMIRVGSAIFGNR